MLSRKLSIHSLYDMLGSVPEFIQHMKQEIYFMKCKKDIEKVLLYLVFEMDV